MREQVAPTAGYKKKTWTTLHYPLMRSWRTRKIDMQVAHAAYSADINFATILPFDLTAKFDKATPCRGKMPPSVR